MLSVAARCPIVPCYREFLARDEIQRVECFPNSWDLRPHRVLISLVSDSLTDFLSQALPALRASVGAWKTPILTEYFWRAHQETTAEHEFLLASVFTEAVKCHYARNVARHPLHLKASGVIRHFLIEVTCPGSPRSSRD